MTHGFPGTLQHATGIVQIRATCSTQMPALCHVNLLNLGTIDCQREPAKIRAEQMYAGNGGHAIISQRGRKRAREAIHTMMENIPNHGGLKSTTGECERC